MLFMLIYLIGWIPAIFAIRNLWPRKELGIFFRVGQSLLIFLFSWAGCFVYSYIIRGMLDARRTRTEHDELARTEQEFYDELQGME